VAGKLTIDDDDVEPLPGQALGDQRSRNAGADNEGITFEIFAHREPRRTPSLCEPRRTAAAQVGLFGII
jgi:hypothetical protein